MTVLDKLQRWLQKIQKILGPEALLGGGFFLKKWRPRCSSPSPSVPPGWPRTRHCGWGCCTVPATRSPAGWTCPPFSPFWPTLQRHWACSLPGTLQFCILLLHLQSSPFFMSIRSVCVTYSCPNGFFFLICLTFADRFEIDK